jgi:hypothetical protein
MVKLISAIMRHLESSVKELTPRRRDQVQPGPDQSFGVIPEVAKKIVAGPAQQASRTPTTPDLRVMAGVARVIVIDREPSHLAGRPLAQGTDASLVLVERPVLLTGQSVRVLDPTLVSGRPALHDDDPVTRRAPRTGERKSSGGRAAPLT